MCLAIIDTSVIEQGVQSEIRRNLSKAFDNDKSYIEEEGKETDTFSR